MGASISYTLGSGGAGSTGGFQGAVGRDGAVVIIQNGTEVVHTQEQTVVHIQHETDKDI